MQIQTNDYQMRLGLLIREKTAYLLTGLAIVVLAFVSVFYLRTTHSLTLPMTRPDTTQQVVVTQQEQKSMPVVEHYTVQEGESLWMIAENTYGDGLKAYDIAKANTIADSNVISVGQDIVLPNVDTQRMMTAVPVQENGQITEVAAQTQRVTSAPTSYTVQTGDYLFAISEKIYGDGNMWPLIAQANNITNPDTIYKDTVLILPQKK